MTKWRRYLLLLLLVSGLTACNSFHLRGSVALPLSLQPAFVQTANPYSEFAAELSRVLHASGVALSPQRETAQLVIQIERETISRRVLTVAGTGKAQEYELHYTVVFAFQTPHAPASPSQSPSQTINLVRDYLFDAADVLGQAQQEALLQQDMERDAVQLILRHLTAKVGL